ncbi:MAG TPA: hypothetical protein VMJ94_01980 [Nitrososphaera sp.]|nr:hypothetical protein [Nitrososphaera sp.]
MEEIMLKKYLSLVLVALLVHVVSAAPAFAKSRAEKEARFAEKVRANILKLGVGPEVLVRVKLRDKTKLEGYISEAATDSFVVVSVKNGRATTVTYPQVKAVQGNNLSTGAKIAIGVGIVIAVAAILVLWARHDIRSKL